MNDNKSKTYLHPATGSYSSTDLNLCSPVLLPNFTWKVTEDLCGSDHFPILLSSTQPSSNIQPQKWKLSKANWNKFETLCEQSITHDKFEDCDDPTKLFTSLLIEAAKQSSLRPRQIQNILTSPGTMMIVNRLSETENKPLEILTSDLPRKITICSIFPGQKPVVPLEKVSASLGDNMSLN